ncbi:hypothetical protein ACIRD0_37305 [Streptomyces microflavus]
MKKCAAKCCERVGWLEALKVTAKWVASSAMRELGRWVLEMWLL